MAVHVPGRGGGGGLLVRCHPKKLRLVRRIIYTKPIVQGKLQPGFQNDFLVPCGTSYVNSVTITRRIKLFYKHNQEFMDYG
jgi:hypothetical protein